MSDRKQNCLARLLIVDDEPSIRYSLACVLTEIGYDVRSAEDGFSALLEIRNEVPEILLSDLNMPGMSGFELLSEVRRQFPAIQTIAMSGAFRAMRCHPALPPMASIKKAAAWARCCGSWAPFTAGMECPQTNRFGSRHRFLRLQEPRGDRERAFRRVSVFRRASVFRRSMKDLSPRPLALQFAIEFALRLARTRGPGA